MSASASPLTSTSSSDPDLAVIKERLEFKLKDIPVEHYDESLSANVIDACRRTKNVGLTHIRLEFGRFLFCLTTGTAIYVMDTKHASHVNMIRNLLETDMGVKFYITRGPHIAFRLESDLGITLDDRLIIDLPAFEVFLSMRRSCLNGSLSGEYRMDRLLAMKDVIRHYDRRDLISIYLNITLPERDKEQEKQETKLIAMDPQSAEAKDVIRKRACLIDELAARMEKSFEKMTYQVGNNLYRFPHQVDEERYIEWEKLLDKSYATVLKYLRRN